VLTLCCDEVVHIAATQLGEKTALDTWNENDRIYLHSSLLVPNNSTFIMPHLKMFDYVVVDRPGHEPPGSGTIKEHNV
jgi:hypothetical protein